MRRCIHLSKSHRVKSRSLSAHLDIIREGYSYEIMHSLVKETKTCDSACLCSKLHHPKLFNISVTCTFQLKFEHVHLAALRCTILIWFTLSFVWGSHTAEGYSSYGLTRVLYKAVSLILGIFVLILHFRKHIVLLALPVILSVWEFQVRPLETSTPRYLAWPWSQ